VEVESSTNVAARDLTVVTKRKGIARLMVSIAIVHLSMVAVNFSGLMDHSSFNRAFSLDREATFNAWLSSTLLVIIALGAGVAAYVERAAGHRRRIWMGWLVVGVAFFALSVDETASMHEMAGRFVDRFLDVPGLPGVYNWVLVVGPLALLFALLMAFWLVVAIGVRTTTSRMAMMALGLWVMVPLLEAAAPTLGSPLWLIAIEESFEVIGEVLMLGAVLVYLADRMPLHIGRSRALGEADSESVPATWMESAHQDAQQPSPIKPNTTHYTRPASDD